MKKNLVSYIVFLFLLNATIFAGVSLANSDELLIASARSAAPPNVARGATIVALESDGTVRTLLSGTNGFTCVPDNPATPGPDSMCMDKNGLEWAMAWLEHRNPPSDKLGFIYMLAGGTDASNTDPYASGPDAGKHWIQTGPHVMIVGANNDFYDLYPKNADPDTSQPYVMWAGTPYVHLMAPAE